MSTEAIPSKRPRRAEDEQRLPASWPLLADAGIPWVGVPEQQGGAGGSLTQLMLCVREAARHAVSIPLGEMAAVANWLLGASGLELPAILATCAVEHDPAATLERRGQVWCLRGELRSVPWARDAQRIVALIDEKDSAARYVVSIPRSAIPNVRQRMNIAGEPRDDLDFRAGVELSDADVSQAPEHLDHDHVRARAALVRSMQIVGAAAGVLDLSVQYANDRVQFGAPIARFQAIKFHLVRIAEEAAVAEALGQRPRSPPSKEAADSAVEAVAAAKTCACRTATEVAAIAHQVHGAIGLTWEYDLQLLPRRLWAWRDEYGTEQFWAQRLGAASAAWAPTNSGRRSQPSSDAARAVTTTHRN